MPIGAHHAGSNSGEYQDTFQSFTEDQYPNIQDSGSSGDMRCLRIGITSGGNSLPYQHCRDDCQGSEKQSPTDIPADLPGKIRDCRRHTSTFLVWPLHTSKPIWRELESAER